MSDPRIEAVARALTAYETNGLCEPGKACELCDCHMARLSNEQRAEDYRHAIARATVAVKAADDAWLQMIMDQMVKGRKDAQDT